MKHIKSFGTFIGESDMNESENEKNSLISMIDAMVDEFGGFDNHSIRINDNINVITVTHTKVNKEHMDEVDTELIKPILKELGRQWGHTDTTSTYFAFVRR